MALSRSALERRLGLQDPRGPQGIMSRGAPVYNGGTPQAQAGGGPQYGRPPSGPPMPRGEENGQPPSSLTTLLGSLPPQAAGPSPMASMPGPPPGLAGGALPGGAPPMGGPPGLAGTPGLSQQGGTDPTAIAAILGILRNRLGGASQGQ